VRIFADGNTVVVRQSALGSRVRPGTARLLRAGACRQRGRPRQPQSHRSP
jgi:hypothetical protein